MIYRNIAEDAEKASHASARPFYCDGVIGIGGRGVG